MSFYVCCLGVCNFVFNGFYYSVDIQPRDEFVITVRKCYRSPVFMSVVSLSLLGMSLSSDVLCDGGKLLVVML